jgi:replicative DNA helicase
MGRFMLSVPSEFIKEVDLLKKESFYNKPYSEIYRHLLALGIEEMKRRNGKKITETNEVPAVEQLRLESAS